ncbi:MAG TPA: hypothetical protein VFE78_13840 [Gemmataceae bacterium]|jgi:hypothetical protein|nr:hypothetical protein [Gemmataceae bacterium]
MRTHWLRGCVLLALVGLAGCSRTTPDAAPEDTETRLGDKIDVSLADWLKLSRAELAKKAEETAVTVAKQQEWARTHEHAVELLPQLHPGASVPVFQEAKFSAAGLSLPPYLKEGSPDAAAALHLARFGDHEAAVKLGAPADRLEALRAERNYPVEWTRLVGLTLLSAQYKLAGGGREGPDGATELVCLHRQLREVLGPKAAAGPLGATLLPFGRRALTLAAAAWQDPKQNKTALAKDLEGALAGWGNAPEPAPALRPGASQAEVTALFGAPAEGRAVSVDGAAVRRVLDLLALPLPVEEVGAVVAFLGEKGELAELLVTYKPRAGELFPEPANLALHLADHGIAGQDAPGSAGVRRQTYAAGGLSYDIARVSRGKALGALVRVAPAGAGAPAASFSRDPRDFGAVHFDGTFEQVRVNLDPQQGGQTVLVDAKDALARITQPVAKHAPVAAGLKREAGQNLLESLTLRWADDLNHDAVSALLRPLWAAYGNARFEGGEDDTGGFLVWTWEDAKTRVKLRVPFDEKSPELVVADARGPAALAARAEEAARFDKEYRAARLKAGKPLTRLARSFPSINDMPFEAVALGTPRAEALAALPRSQSIRHTALADGVSLLFAGESGSKLAARQMFVRFGPDDRVAEVRVRYQDSPALLAWLQRKPQGKAEKVASPWAGLWPDLPAQKPAPARYRWADDRTELTYDRDGGGVAEVVLRDATAGAGLSPLHFCGRGVEGCGVGDFRADVLKRWGVSTPRTAAGGAEVLGPPAGSPYDLLLVWSEGGKVTRVIARYKTRSTLQQAWARDIDHLGCVCRRDGKFGQVLEAYGWHDDATRVRTFVQDTEKGPQMFTEWRAWPVEARKVAAQP